MAWIEQEVKRIKVGDYVTTTKIHKHPWGMGYFEKGSKVKITAIDDMRGYSIADDEGHSITEIGWVI